MNGHDRWLMIQVSDERVSSLQPFVCVDGWRCCSVPSFYRSDNNYQVFISIWPRYSYISATTIVVGFICHCAHAWEMSYERTFSFSPRSYRLQPTWYDIYLVPRYTDVCHSYGVCVPLLRPSRSTFSIYLYFSSRDETSQVNRLVTITKLHTWKCSYVVEDHVFSSQRQETTYILRV